MTDMDRAGGEREREAAHEAWIRSDVGAATKAHIAYEAGWLARAALSREPREEGAWLPEVIEAATALVRGVESYRFADSDRNAERVSMYVASGRLGRALKGYAHPPAPAGDGKEEIKGSRYAEIVAAERADLLRSVDVVVRDEEALLQDPYSEERRRDVRVSGLNLAASVYAHRDVIRELLRPATPAERAAAGVREDFDLTSAPKWINDAANAIMGEVIAATAPDADLSDEEDYASLRGTIEGVIMRAMPHPAPDAGGVGEAKAVTPADLARSLDAVADMIDGATSLDNVARLQRERDDARKALTRAMELLDWAVDDMRGLCAEVDEATGGDDSTKGAKKTLHNIDRFQQETATEARRGESGEAIAAQGGTL